MGGQARKIAMGRTAPDKVTYHHRRERGYRAYINRDGVAVTSGWHDHYIDALTDLAVRLAAVITAGRVKTEAQEGERG